ncbi:mannose-1-phosphate guanylyltransferase [Breznakiella homolactica]|uniref:Mannose-1-phosphate guanylyltransferase n=1 Tax=Breznakiella homolactica TaxID=2798577 RepID=A0A7T7XM71_9SPIR|nr:mannose-1-phosphate guanylyltransferase [Breznakiella homolactica]QQO08939.1 mannose-1-phosphate guanylyltransferase [Breznakiella homolactica]
MFNDCIIMAGGSGTRLWPASNSKTPKQFLTIPGSGNFFKAAVDRALSVIDIEGDGKVIIIAGKNHVPHVSETCRSYSRDILKHLVLIPEPEAKNTAPAIVCGALYTDWISGRDRTILVLTSDHIINPLEVFQADAAAAAALAEKQRLVVFGIPPSKPETGYGYIEAGDGLSVSVDAELRKAYGAGGGPRAFTVTSFKEKPDKKTAEQYLASGRYYWNSGMFAFSSRFILEEFRKNAPEVILPFDKLRAPDERSYTFSSGLQVLTTWLDLDKAYAGTAAISFDYAIAEKTAKRAMVAGAFDWVDIGSWDEYAALTGRGRSEVYTVDSGNCFVDSDIPVALAGVDGLIVVVRSGKNGETPSVLIAKKGESQKVREISDQIRAAGRTELL